MVKIRTRIHDKFSLEFKIWHMQENNRKADSRRICKYRLESWIFVPATLDINALTYSREHFYSDITNYYRAITPVYTLEEMAYGDKCTVSETKVSFNPNAGSPFGYLSNAVYNLINYPTEENLSEYEYQIKMFCAIFKCALRERYNALKANGGAADFEGFRNDLFVILKNYALLCDCLKNNVKAALYNYCSFGEEFIINLSESYSYKIYEVSNSSKSVAEWLLELGRYKESRGYGVLKEGDDKKNANLLHRWGVLKKYVESDLFLSADKRKSGVLKEQVYYSIAAGLSMIFATAVAFTFQQKYGNFTMPLFVALVVSYMLKDRIKELVRSAFSSNRKIKYFDNKTLLGVKDTIIGYSREGFDIIPQSKVPQEIMEIRNRSFIVDAENRINNESILFYRNLIRLDQKKLEETSEYKIEGINEILMLNLSSFVKKMDNPQNVYKLCNAEKEFVNVSVKKIYYINFVLRISWDEGVFCQRYRVIMNRDGIVSMESLM